MALRERAIVTYNSRTAEDFREEMRGKGFIVTEDLETIGQEHTWTLTATAPPPVPVVCHSRREIRGLLGEKEDLLETCNIVSVLDTGLPSPFIYSIYRKTDKYQDYRTGVHSNLLTLHAEDIHEDNLEAHKDTFGGERVDFAFFTPEQADRVCRWFVRQSSSNAHPFRTHCFAGISRSSAVALFLSRRLGFSDQEFHDYNEEQTGRYLSPNPHILKLLEERWKEQKY
jgi:predicted protein tyrosine phosphatase